jgi:hypothetical protein
VAGAAVATALETTSILTLTVSIPLVFRQVMAYVFEPSVIIDAKPCCPLSFFTPVQSPDAIQTYGEFVVDHVSFGEDPT